MKTSSKLIYMLVGGFLAIGLAFSGYAAFAQVGAGDGAAPQAERADGVLPGLSINVERFHGFGRGEGLRGDSGQALADALGISLEELQAASSAVRDAQLDQAVADGLLTQEQADAIRERADGFPGHVTLGQVGAKLDEALAAELGITVEALQAAHDQVMADRLAALVADGSITQAQADEITARRAVQSRLDTEAIQAAVQTAYEDAVAQALADGAITQAQADDILEQLAEGVGPGFGFGIGKGRGFGHGRGDHGFRGGLRGFGSSDAAPQLSNQDA